LRSNAQFIWQYVADDCGACQTNTDPVTQHLVTPEEFHRWNPSVGLDCQPWQWQSYCIITQEKLDKLPTTTASSSKVSTSTTTVSSLAPSPTAWTPLGCYAENSKRPILEKNMSPVGGDVSLSILNCKSSCYSRAYKYAGVQEGNQCWCSSYVGGEWSKNQTDCNVPCTGDKATFCGGKGVLNVFKALENEKPAVSTTNTGVVATSATAGAVKNRTLPWM
jgi:hypothetical protein